jgi:hypothetical protein
MTCLVKGYEIQWAIFFFGWQGKLSHWLFIKAFDLGYDQAYFEVLV